MDAFHRFSERRDGKRHSPVVDKPRKVKLLRSYAPDWAITIILIALFSALDKVKGYWRVFSLDDTSLRHPHADHERVPNWALYIIAVICPFLLQIVINLGTTRSWWDFHNSSLGLILGLGLTGSITQFTKVITGRPRPDLIDRCQPLAGSVDPPWGLSNATICTQTDLDMLGDGFRSFPSGHASLSFAGLGFLSFYLAGKLHLFDERGHAGKAWLSLLPFSAAALVAITRTMDYRHHWHDVLAGALLGTVLAYFAYRQYYPSLASPLAHRPYSPRVRRTDADAVLPVHKDHGGASGDGPLQGYTPYAPAGVPMREVQSARVQPSPLMRGASETAGYTPVQAQTHKHAGAHREGSPGRSSEEEVPHGTVPRGGL